MTTECITENLSFKSLSGRKVIGRFDGGKISSDGGLLLLRELENRVRIIHRLADCFRDYRMKPKIIHSVGSLVGQRIYGLALGYEDLNDHDVLRGDALLSLAYSESANGRQRRCDANGLSRPAGKSTLNRLELTPADADGKHRNKKIVFDSALADELLADVCLEQFAEEPEWITLDIDATDDPLHGNQEGAFYHGYYKGYCYLPLYIFADGFPLCARLRTADKDPADGALEELQRIISRIRARFKRTKILVRGDGGFSRDDIMSWCETEYRVFYVFGFSKNTRLEENTIAQRAEAKRRCLDTGKPARCFADFRYKTRTSWTRERRIVCKAEHLEEKANSRYIALHRFRFVSFPQRSYTKKHTAHAGIWRTESKNNSNGSLRTEHQLKQSMQIKSGCTFQRSHI